MTLLWECKIGCQFIPKMGKKSCGVYTGAPLGDIHKENLQEDYYGRGVNLHARE